MINIYVIKLMRKNIQFFYIYVNDSFAVGDENALQDTIKELEKNYVGCG